MESVIYWQRPLVWAAIFAYLAAWLPLLLGTLFEKERFLPWAIRISVVGLVVQCAWMVLRWIEAGHGPYINLYEVTNSIGIIAMLIYLTAQWKYPGLRVLGIFILPVVFLLIGFGMLASRAPVAATPILDSAWLVVHVLTAKLAIGSYLVSVVLASVYLKKHRGRTGRILDRFPSNPVNEEFNRKFISLGFLSHTIMLVSGSIWANVAFGAYWSWDPIETWSLISWLIYGILYHLVTIHGWKGVRMAWLSIVAMLSMVFALFGVPYLFVGSHNLFL